MLVLILASIKHRRVEMCRNDEYSRYCCALTVRTGTATSNDDFGIATRLSCRTQHPNCVGELLFGIIRNVRLGGPQTAATWGPLELA